MYDACRDDSLRASNKVKTQMIWGCQWDVTMNWLVSSGAKTSDEVNKDSSSWGNYKNSTGNAAVVVTENGTETKEYGKEQNTGYSEYWKANNIYDLAGNCEEWTQEAERCDDRVRRGSDYREFSSYNSASYRSEYGISATTGSISGSRPTLIIK